MIFSKKQFRWIHKIALFAMVFASLAPSISHALAAKQGINSFVQAVCASNGEKITIQVITTKGQQLSTNLGAEAASQSPANIVLHLNHCPFCANPNTSIAIEPPVLPIITLLAMQAQYLAIAAQPLLPRFSVLLPPAQAPPSL
ncbi:MAG: DUF2946 domain-containing protein [Methylophilaceae bacterium]|jgi:hypothetical protein|nr:MAG: DUF2946 domain-containing protein [Methylophilaceae bacterium]